MKRLAFVCTLVALASPALHAQNASEEHVTSRSAYNIQENQNRQGLQSFNRLEQGDRQAWVNSLANLTKLRGKLAEAWQNLGMTPQAAQAVAAAYQPDHAENVPYPSLLGKSDQEVAAMLQSALTKKNYLVANQLLIDYQRKQLRLGTPTSPAGRY